MAACRKLFDQIMKQNLQYFRGNTWLLRKPCLARSIIKHQQTTSMSVFHTKLSGNIYCRKRFYSTVGTIRKLDEVTFHMISDETLHVLMEYFEELGDLGHFEKDYDIEYSNGVLTVKLGGSHGTYVVNKQTPNKQIWLSSPSSGPKRYDFADSGYWVYTRDGISLHQLLSEEISCATGQHISFTNLNYGGGCGVND